MCLFYYENVMIKWFEDFVVLVKGAWDRLRGEALPRLFVALLLLIFSSATIVFWIEYPADNHDFKSVGDTIWWALVTMTTVGYGDKTPVTGLGRALAVVIMFSGISLTAFFTAFIASYYVDKRIREGKGMEEIKWKRHMVICGWNSHAMKMLDKLGDDGANTPHIVLVNNLPEEHMANILQAAEGARVKYVRGNFVQDRKSVV